MGLLDFFLHLFSDGSKRAEQLQPFAEKLGLPTEDLLNLKPSYRNFTIPKKSGGTRRITAPSDDLKRVQRRILDRVLSGLAVHPAAHGFEKGRSIVTNAREHVGNAIVLQMDIRNFFPSTGEKRIRGYFAKIGYNGAVLKFLTEMTTYNGALPQGAPTSPKLSNLLNYKLDERLSKLAASKNATYTRYADDITFSFPEDKPDDIRLIIRLTKHILDEEGGYRIHHKKKLHIRRAYERQTVTGLVVNRQVNLPRAIRRRLRAVKHYLDTGQNATMTPEQYRGWLAFQVMILKQSEPA